MVASAAGFIDAMAGGGGLLTLPALLAAGVPPAQALATNKLQSSFGSFSATWYFVRNGMVSLKEMKLAIACTFIGSACGAELVQHIDASLLTSLIPILLISISLYFLLAPQTKAVQGNPRLSEGLFAFLSVVVWAFMMVFLAPALVLFSRFVLLCLVTFP
ncbi:TSUP family transporter [Vibrio aestuarianus]|uniref:TSUP family transporter n=1 Tax=Vibrio aestuarianus TaxID=28171 RepID=UPI00237D1FE1|nr:TSUP family transporter [Vibrio aestuarianus]MDE1314665.1 TSUP family transporter [Vibrio aestuarianus]